MPQIHTKPEQIVLKCTDNNRTLTADILSEADFHLRVVLVGTDYPFSMYRRLLTKAYVGVFGGKEFTYEPPRKRQ